MKETTAYRLDPDLLRAMREIRDREGIPVTTQIEFAVREWLTRRGKAVKRQVRRSTTRTRR